MTGSWMALYDWPDVLRRNHAGAASSGQLGKKARVAIAGKLLTVAFQVLRDQRRPFERHNLHREGRRIIQRS